METYMAYWRRGWWAWWLMLVANMCLGAIIVPLAFLLRDQPSTYYLCATLAWLIVGAPVWGWLFERFVRSSVRIDGHSLDG
jgi:hypothetical protein